MAIPQRTPEGKAVLYLVSTGERFERWPVDASEMLARGGYTADDPTGNAGDAHTASDSSAPEPSAPTADPVPHVTAAKATTAAVSPTGAPLAIADPATVSPAAPMQLPASRTPHGRRGR